MTSKRRILVVEDDPVLTRVLRDNLTFDGFDVRCVGDGSLAVAAAKDFSPDLLLLDVTLPGESGFDLCARWRKASRTPIIFLTAMGQKADKVRGLKLGADDYITKPFELDELLARVHAVLRRSRPEIGLLRLGEISVDFARLKAWRGNAELELTHRDYEILKYLAERPHSIVHRDELLRSVWGYADTTNTRAVDHAIARLRKKIESTPHRPRFIHTVHGDGYYLSLDGTELAETEH
jgi:two-component system, OmpR family, response regulator MtrA